jgi:translation elongation factor P/translation initiation factor 5A
MDNENKKIAPKKQSLFPLSAEDIVDNALQNLDENQARQVTQKAADEMVRIAVEKRKAEYRNSAAQEEMRNLVNNANLLDKSVDEYKINSAFETASGTTTVEIRKSKMAAANIAAIIGGIAIIVLLMFFLLKN